MIKDITGRQAIIIVAMVMCATKFFTLPSNLVTLAKQDVVYVMLLFFAVEFLLLLIMVQISMMHPDKTFYQMLEESVGKIIAKAICLLFFVFFIIKMSINIIETYTFFLGTLYDELSPLLYICPMIFVVFYMTYIGLRSIGRSVEILWVFVVLGLFVSLFVTLPSVDFAYLLPVMENGPDMALEALSKNALWFGDYFVYLFFIGKIKFEKNYFKKMAIISGVTLFTIVFFVAVIHCLFPYISSIIHYGVSDMSQINAKVTDVGRLDWINVAVWTFASIIQTVIFAYCAEESLSCLFNISKKVVSCFISLAILSVLLYWLKFNIVNLIDFVQGPLRYLFAVLFIISLNIITVHCILRFKEKRRKGVRTQ